MRNSVIISLIFVMISNQLSAQQIASDVIKEQITKYKNDLRGPYKDIRWFCTDGSVRQPKDPCPDNVGPGNQHARYKDEVEKLALSNHIFLGQILSFSKTEAFWDASTSYSRLKQYQLDKYLRGVDNGWINRKSQFYRGAIQSEDEEAWGIDFYKWLLSKDDVIQQNFFLVRQSLKDIPHNGDDNLAQLMRSQSKVLSDAYLPFMDLRVKIHAQPEINDIEKVKAFRAKHVTKLSVNQIKMIDDLIVTMTTFFKPIDLTALLQKATLLKETTFGKAFKDYVSVQHETSNTSDLIQNTAEVLTLLKTSVLEEKRPLARLQLLDISLKLEEIIFKNAPLWQPQTVAQLVDKICYLGMATAATGYIEQHEWEALNLTLSGNTTNDTTLGELTTVLQNGRSLVEWSSGMVKATYQETVNTYTAFEPLAYGFIDDKIRGSIALHLGKAVGELGDFIANESALTNKVLSIPNQSTIRGLNPGYAFGELVVIAGSPDDIEVSSNKIYIFQRPPADLKPVAGIATVSEGNMVSHVQLLARNLGIPNTALSDQNLEDLIAFSGQKVFYAVSNKGNVIIKVEQDMSEEERALFAKKERRDEKIEVPVETIILNEHNVLNLRNVDASNSGKICGPKAANLGQLKKMFPEQVVEGLVIPFGIFRDHMDQDMPDQSKTYWQFLEAMFKEAIAMESKGIAEEEIEHYQLRQLETLRAAIKKMPLKTEFITQMENDFKTVLGQDLGAIPVFLRSDTNMEDLKEFTGAGLNLTLFNVVDKSKILEGIKDVWASPYTERSFKWRQKYLLNPENVFPSILVIPSVDVDYSGVLITKGLTSGNDQDLTIAFSRGAGGAVDGQSSETYLLKDAGGYQFLAPSRERYYNSLPTTGGTLKQSATFEQPILNAQNMADIKALAKTIRQTMPSATDADYQGAYDVELGFKDDKLWLFQIRPFVENKKALSSTYLQSITPTVNTNKAIALSKKI
ncbi:PEP/pyruvate-binding domain-containing protein [Olleya sp. UBA1516]|uniref:PEP/pyruvate-binding domain-containing protein n=1 Tax=Olleya sp. UBA1516 TaxID=1947013 RepID=UPI0025FA94BF|nr:PEP/pyruvate-binding domain-containing protein [Olleya sp. UBA1516]|tara:strand:+ start:39827 stop:42733 length:2907 start_codon:yes stop_codon:yes gene_type:complete